MINAQIRKYIDRLAHMYDTETDRFHKLTVFEAMLHFDQIVLVAPELSGVRAYLHEVIKKIEPAYYNNFFKSQEDDKSGEKKAARRR